MKPIQECYPESIRPDGTLDAWSVGDYGPMLASMDGEIVLQVDDKDYQGDSRVLYRDGDRYGLLIFGWGSCSGCDALQACNTVEEIEQLRNSLVESVIWKDSAAAMLEFIKNRDWEAQYSWHAEETQEFVRRATEFLEEALT